MQIEVACYSGYPDEETPRQIRFGYREIMGMVSESLFLHVFGY